MGIKDLLRFLKPYTEPIHVRKYAGKRVGIDAYAWLHRGAYSCSMKLSLNSEGEKKLQYINYFMHRIKLLKHHKITPVVVFDGGNIPCKAGTENERYRRRKVNKEMAMEKLNEGNVGGAIELFQRAISITPSMAHLLIQTLKTENVEFIVAPYEADAQLAYLSSLGEENGGIVAIISEDSDLLAYGCPSIIFKMDRFGNGEEIIIDKVFNSTEIKPSFRNFNTNLFIDMCVLAGCDFLPSIPGIGIVKAHALVSKYRNIDRVLSVLKTDKGKQVPDDYARSFKEAVAVFQHATIYNREKKKVEHMKELPETLLESLGGEIFFLGPIIPPSISTAIAEGNLDPSTVEAYECSLSQKNSGLAEIDQCEVSDPADAVETCSALSQQTNKGNKHRAAKPLSSIRSSWGQRETRTELFYCIFIPK
ncbi:exonuclease 1-like [Chenopodium quinoa]|uniref:exonuclease 1-like n=1 Tax=Chenopodium quinoa TaxID=63459 RepID=UPI000B7966B3|nr:exonuclease 1-like [Chenopodium quinoa]